MKKTIILAFDFDKTLSSDSITGYLSWIGINPDLFWKQVDEWVKKQWDFVLAYLYQLTQWRDKVTLESFQRWGKTLSLYPDVEHFFAHIKQFCARIDPSFSIEFHLVSCGLYDILAHTSIASCFNRIWASHFTYDKQGRVLYPQYALGFTNKIECLLQIMNRQPGQIPFHHLFFIGDGYSDVPAFTLTQSQGGKAIGVYGVDTQEAKTLHTAGYIDACLPASYHPHSPFVQFLEGQIEQIILSYEKVNIMS